MLNLPSIIQNVDYLYDGNLKHYFRQIMAVAKHLRNPYHNFRHTFHVTWLCYNACVFYKDVLNPTDMRNLLIAAMYHDFDHTGRSGNDDLNIELAVRGLKKSIAPTDEPFIHDIISLIKSTQFPHQIKSEYLSLSAQILRDADMSQGLSPVWVQEIIFGLSSEMCLTPETLFEMQNGFFSNLEFSTEWAKSLFPRELIDAKIAESQDYLRLIKDSE